MGPDDFQQYLADVLSRLQGIQDAVDAPVPAAAVTVVAPPADPLPLVIAIALGAVAVVVALIALLLTRQTNRVLRALRPGAAPADPQLTPRRAFGNLLRRYSEILGVEAVTGRIPSRGDTSVAVRVQLEQALSRVREPGAVELLDEVCFARDDLLDLEPALRAAENGLIAMRVEWSIERWVANPRAWLADTREQDRLERLAGRAEVQPHPEPAAAAAS